MHPDRATSEPERLRRTALMAQVNLAYERGDQKAIEKLVSEYGQDPEAITGGDVASRIMNPSAASPNYAAAWAKCSSK